MEFLSYTSLDRESIFVKGVRGKVAESRYQGIHSVEGVTLGCSPHRLCPWWLDPAARLVIA